MVAAKYDNTDGRLRGRALQARRLRVWTRDPHCQMCRTLTNYPDGFQLDHKVAVHKAGENLDDDAVQVLCAPCHETKTAKDMGYTPRAAIGPDGWPMDFDRDGRVKW